MGIIAPINHIELVDDGFGGKEPVVVGTKITVHEIAAMFVLQHSSVEWIVENFDLTPAQIYAAISYYYDHQDQIDREIAEADEHIRTVGKSLQAKIGEMKHKLSNGSAEE